ncbi:hypothetical protein [Elizabethkingia anophelis]|uniref:hypothetical protein n=1 Tax=Elizabethkingia anophelis TaxID=1117645 RepID=UPI0022270902|nr:hypothetical protein [Elizabethkingia anophelis]MCW2463383.1 hypothetical protein [Elizabethkingia anophelis]MCW2467068.1 hypothetical protein [Elizabethkingia anophelis]MCW2470784.1 hypothetical protein [Elizabethkingia anophelis]HBI9690656.1 hypothetical protein [Elizabethkingia anophelis]HBI9694675.1 hypothetical protein [Elizabethkingia anophelis]
MNYDEIKHQVRENFKSVDSEEFLQIQINKGRERHISDCRIYLNDHPDETFDDWKAKVMGGINQNATTNTEIMAIGLWLLALDTINPEDI